MKRLFQGDWKWWLAVIVFSETANAGLISGSGDPLSHSALLGGDQEGFDNVASQDVSRITLGGVTFSGVGGGIEDWVRS